MHPYNRKAGEDLTHAEEERPRGQRRRGWRDVAISQGMLVEEAKSRISAIAPEGVWPRQHLDFSPGILTLDF